MSEQRKNGVRVLAALGLVATVLVAPLASTVGAGENTNGPVFTKAFSPDTIGPGNVSTLTLTINNAANAARGGLAFTDTLPAGVTIATPANASTTCPSDGASGPTLSAPDGGGTIAFSDASIGAGETCVVTVDVTAPESGEYQNVTSSLSFDDGSSGSAVADLVVDGSLPRFTKSFSPSTVALGGRSTLTLTIDTGPALGYLNFTDELPPGMTIASPAGASTTCGNPSAPAELTAEPGTSTISLLAFGFLPNSPALPSESSCTTTVDVIGGGGGALVNSVELDTDASTTDGNAGKATAVLNVTVSPINLAKSFRDDPVVPGGSVILDFTISNVDRAESATSVAFTDLLPAGVFESVLANDCGGTLTGMVTAEIGFSGTTTSEIGFSGGTVAAGTTCTISVELSIPSSTPAGSYPNTTSAVTGTLGASPVEGNPATDTLFVFIAPLLTKEFTDDPVGAGGAATLEFTITNPSSSPMTDIEFTDDLNTAIPGLAANGFVSGNTDVPVFLVCGDDSKLTVFNPPDFGAIVTPPDPTLLEFTGGSLGAAGSADDSCTFSLVVDVPVGTPSGTYTNTSSTIAGTDGQPRTGPAATGDLIVVGAPKLTKEFTDDPVDPGDSVNLRFTLEHEALATGDATGIAFSDDLAATLAGLTATSATNDCGASVDITDPTNIEVSGATVAPNDSCTIDVTLDVPNSASPGSHPNTTGDLTATVAGVAVIGLPASDDLQIASVDFTKEFLEGTYIAGQEGTLRFHFDNRSALDATISFTDALDDVLTGLTATGQPTADDCGGTLTGASSLTYTGGAVDAGLNCTIDVPILVPADAADGSYLNVASGTITLTDLPPQSVSAADSLIVNSTILEVTKDFTNDPVEPGGSVNLEITLTNLSTTDPVTDISFTDDLDDALPGLVATGTASPPTCNGMATQDPTFPTSLFEYDGASLAPSASCTIVLTLDVPDAPLPPGPYINTIDDVTGLVGAIDLVDAFGAAAFAPNGIGSGLVVFGNTATATLMIGTPPTVTINQAAGQADPTNASPINFTVVFSEPVTRFGTSSVAVNNGTVASVTPAGANTFTVAVTPTADGFVTATVPAGGAENAAGTENTASTSTDNVVEYDTTDPIINLPLPGGLTVNNDPGQPGANVNYLVTTTDGGPPIDEVFTGQLATDSAITAALVPPGGLVCTPPSGSFFPIGTTLVTCTATDLAGNVATATFNVIVVDNEPPVISPAPNVNQIIASGTGTPVTYPTPSATDNSGSVSVACAPASGSVFGIGTTTVTCTATDPANNSASTSFTVTVTLNRVRLPETGGGLDGFTLGLQLFAAGLALLAISRLRGRRRLAPQ